MLIMLQWSKLHKYFKMRTLYVCLIFFNCVINNVNSSCEMSKKNFESYSYDMAICNTSNFQTILSTTEWLGLSNVQTAINDVITKIPTRNIKILEIIQSKIDKIQNKTFTIFPELTALIIRNSNVEEFDATVLNNLPKLKSFYFTSNDLQVKDLKFENSDLEKLHLAQNQLKSVPTSILKLTQLKELFLQKNSIDKITNTSFSKLMFLKTLRLDGNDIRWIDPVAFQDLGNLTSLYLSNNHFENVSKLFKNLAGLTSLYMDNCSLTSLRKEDIKPLSRLQKLSLTGNSLKDANLIFGYTNSSHLRLKLKSIWLDNNMLTCISNSTFNIPTLKLLSLAHNRIQEIELGAFNNLNAIEFLFLQHNRITIPDDFIFTMESLTVIDLSFNKLQKAISWTSDNLLTLNLGHNKINGSLFQVTKNIANIDLSFNDIMDINNLMFISNSDRTRLVDVNLYGNPLKKFEIDYFDKNPHVGFLYVDTEFVLSHDSELKSHSLGKKVVTGNDVTKDCKANLYYYAALAFLIGLFVAAAVGIVYCCVKSKMGMSKSMELDTYEEVMGNREKNNVQDITSRPDSVGNIYFHVQSIKGKITNPPYNTMGKDNASNESDKYRNIVDLNTNKSKDGLISAEEQIYDDVRGEEAIYDDIGNVKQGQNFSKINNNRKDDVEDIYDDVGVVRKEAGQFKASVHNNDEDIYDDVGTVRAAFRQQNDVRNYKEEDIYDDVANYRQTSNFRKAVSNPGAASNVKWRPPYGHNRKD